MVVGDGVLDIPTAARRQFGMRENLPIEVLFFRRVVEDADPYGTVYFSYFLFLASTMALTLMGRP